MGRAAIARLLVAHGYDGLLQRDQYGHSSIDIACANIPTKWTRKGIEHAFGANHHDMHCHAYASSSNSLGADYAASFGANGPPPKETQTAGRVVAVDPGGGWLGEYEDVAHVVSQPPSQCDFDVWEG